MMLYMRKTRRGFISSILALAGIGIAKPLVQPATPLPASSLHQLLAKGSFYPNIPQAKLFGALHADGDAWREGMIGETFSVPTPKRFMPGSKHTREEFSAVLAKCRTHGTDWQAVRV